MHDKKSSGCMRRFLRVILVKRVTNEDMEEASGEGEQNCWFGEKGCHESSEMENGSYNTNFRAIIHFD